VKPHRPCRCDLGIRGRLLREPLGLYRFTVIHGPVRSDELVARLLKISRGKFLRASSLGLGDQRSGTREVFGGALDLSRAPQQQDGAQRHQESL
jgi:hypothetical protein